MIVESANMPFDRSRLAIKPLSDRKSKLRIDDILDLDSPLPEISGNHSTKIDFLVEAIKKARRKKAPVILMYGAHLFRNGLSPFVIRLMEAGYVQHLVTNGAGVIHDWEMAYHGETTEDVNDYLKIGQFGIWEETGFYQNLAILLGAADNLGYGESIGRMMADDSIIIPDPERLQAEINNSLDQTTMSDAISMKVALLETIRRLKLKSGKIEVLHPYNQYSLVYSAYQKKIPLSVCPGIGYDIIYTHPMNSGAAIGYSALIDFLSFTQTISNLENGVLLSVGSAVMSSQITEKALSMARNVAMQNRKSISDFHIAVVDIQPGNWDWEQSEPPKDHPGYYLRFCKSFSRMGGRFEYLDLDNRAFIQNLYSRLVD